jgi:hypothetical protein
MEPPLIDGLFPAIVLAGGIDDPAGILTVGLLVFGGSATLAVILGEVDGTVRSRVRSVPFVGVPLIVLAAIEASLAPTVAAVIDLGLFERFAAVLILAVAARTASARIAEYVPRPGVVVGLGLSPVSIPLAVRLDPGLVARAAGSALVGLIFALAVATLGPWLRNAVDLDRFRFGCAVALGVLPLGLFGVIPRDSPLALAVPCFTALFAFEPSRGGDSWLTSRPNRIDVTTAMADGDRTDGDPTTPGWTLVASSATLAVSPREEQA